MGSLLKKGQYCVLKQQFFLFLGGNFRSAGWPVRWPGQAGYLCGTDHQVHRYGTLSEYIFNIFLYVLFLTGTYFFNFSVQSWEVVKICLGCIRILSTYCKMSKYYMYLFLALPVVFFLSTGSESKLIASIILNTIGRQESNLACHTVALSY